MTWKNFTIANQEFDLSHLAPFTVKVTPKIDNAPTYKVLVKFGHHTFTRELTGSDPQHLHYGPQNDVRCFCTQRHGLSLVLPMTISARATGGKAFWPARLHAKEGRNFLLIEGVPGLTNPYVVAFNLEIARNVEADLTMFVVSAHEKTNLPPKRKLDSISFPTLVSKVVRGEQIIRPPYRP